jgi:hypothetical protein
MPSPPTNQYEQEDHSMAMMVRLVFMISDSHVIAELSSVESPLDHKVPFFFLSESCLICAVMNNIDLVSMLAPVRLFNGSKLYGCSEHKLMERIRNHR